MAARTKRGNGSIRFDKKANAYVGRLSILVNGKRERPTVTGKTFTECSNALRRLQHKIESGETMAARDRETVAAYLANWLEVSNLASSTLTRYRSLATKVIARTWFADLKMHELAPTHVLKLYKAMASESDRRERKCTSCSTLRSKTRGIYGGSRSTRAISLRSKSPSTRALM